MIFGVWIFCVGTREIGIESRIIHKLLIGVTLFFFTFEVLICKIFIEIIIILFIMWQTFCNETQAQVMVGWKVEKDKYKTEMSANVGWRAWSLFPIK